MKILEESSTVVLELSGVEARLIYNIVNRLSVKAAVEKYECTYEQADCIIPIYETLSSYLNGRSDD